MKKFLIALTLMLLCLCCAGAANAAYIIPSQAAARASFDEAMTVTKETEIDLGGFDILLDADSGDYTVDWGLTVKNGTIKAHTDESIFRVTTNGTLTLKEGVSL